jgi:hypothetical protein
MFPERYALILYIKEIGFVFTGLKVTQGCGINEFNYCSVFVEGSKKIGFNPIQFRGLSD